MGGRYKENDKIMKPSEVKFITSTNKGDSSVNGKIVLHVPSREIFVLLQTTSLNFVLMMTCTEC